MNRRPQDNADELVQKLSEVVRENALSQGEPEDVFSDAGASDESRDPDAQIAAFDTYMASLLGELGIEDGEVTVTGSQSAAVDAMPTQETLENEFLPYEPEGLSVAQATEDTELSPAQTDVLAQDDQVTFEEPNTDVADVDGQELAAEQEEQPPREEAPFEVIEQLSIKAREDEADESEYEKQAVATLEQTQQEENISSEPIALDGAPEDGVYEEMEEIDPIEADNAKPEDQLQEGDLLLDADDEIPPTEAEREPEPCEVDKKIELQTSDAEQEAPVAAEPPAPTPVPSPLDAVRAGEAQRQAEAAAPRPKQSPLDAMAAQSRGNVSPFGLSSALSGRHTRERTLTDQDVELLLALGYDTSLTQKVGSQRVEAIRYRRLDDEKTKRKLRRAYGSSGEEYTGHAQDQHIAAQYRKHTTFALARLLLTLLLSVVLLALDLLPTMRDRLPTAFSGETVMGFCTLLGITLLCLGAMLSWQLMLRGIRSLLRFSPIPASVPALLLMFTLAYDVISLLDPFGGISLNFSMGLVLVLTATAEVMRVRREQQSFEVVCAHSRKIVMESTPPRKKKVVRDGHIVKIIDDEVAERRFRVRPTDQVAGYFRRNGEDPDATVALSPLLMISFALALVLGALAMVISRDVSLMRAAFLLTLHVSLPVTVAISYAYPMLIAAQKLSAQGCAIVGYRAVNEYAGEKTLTFDDTEMLRSKSSTEITIKGSGDTKKYIRYAKRLFRTLGGTLYTISTSELSEEAYEERVEILKISEQGVQARIDGKVNVLAGTSAFMVAQGIRVPDQSAELLVRRNVESSILYLAFDGKLRLGYEIDYRISGRFDQMVADLSRNGTSVAIETCDPCVFDEFLVRSRKEGSAPVTVTKPVRFERHVDSLICDSGVVATRSARDIASAVQMCEALAENQKRMTHFQRIGAVLGGVLVLGLLLWGRLDHSATLLAAAVQTIWCVPVVLSSKNHLINEQHSEKKS